MICAANQLTGFYMTAKQALNGLKLNFEKNSSVEEEQDVIFNFSSSFSFPFFISILPKVTGTLNNFSLNHGKIIFYLFEQKSKKYIVTFLLLLHYRRPDVFIANFEHTYSFFYCFYCWLWTSKYQLGYLCYLITNTHWFYGKICNKQKEVKKNNC